MGKRSYNQFCPVAYSLDIIGDRWTLLMARELLFGPRRFTDLQRGLPGMGTNLLAQRLKELEESGIIRQRKLPPPAATSVYELTEFGESLRGIIDEMTLWGFRFMTSENLQTDYLSVMAMMSALKILFDPSAATNAHIACEVHASGEVFSLNIDEGHLKVSAGGNDHANLVIRTDPKVFVGVLLGGIDIDYALKENLAQIDQGDRSMLEQLTGVFRVPEIERLQTV
jgi:DNA-binding HxlR family transcriptional regulator